MADEKAKYSKPASQLDLEARQENDNASPLAHDFSSEDVLNQRGFVGVDPVYQNYANVGEKPIRADEGAEAEVFKTHAEQQGVEFEEADDDEETDTGEDEDDEPRRTGSTPPPVGSGTPNPGSQPTTSSNS